jgi:GTPase SAR1 family protein
MEINESRNELVCKLVYVGPALAGKTANLECLYRRTPAERRAKLTSVACANGRSEFDQTEFRLGDMGGRAVRLRVATTPCADACDRTYAHLLRDADGILFVADSDPARQAKNVEALACLEETLREQGRELADLPLVFQWNKRDLTDATPVRRLNTLLNRGGRAAVEAVVPEGLGVLSSFKLLVEKVLVEATRQTSPFVDEDLAAEAARTCSSRLSVQAPPRPNTRRFPRPKTGRLARPPKPEAVEAPKPEVEQAVAAPQIQSRRASSPYAVVGSRRLQRRRRPTGVAALIVITAVAVGGLLGSQDAFRGLASTIAAAVADE